MKNVKSAGNEATPKMTKGQTFLEEWKRRRKEDEEQFLKDLRDPAHQERMEILRGKIIKNGKTV